MKTTLHISLSISNKGKGERGTREASETTATEPYTPHVRYCLTADPTDRENSGVFSDSIW